MPHRPSAITALLLSLLATTHSASAQLFTSLGPIAPNGSSAARAISADGATIVGEGTATINNITSTQPFRWTRIGGMTLLPAGQLSSAAGVSSDGQVIVGSSGDSVAYRPSFRWSAATGLEITGTLPGGTYAYLSACTADGSMITGVSRAPSFPNGRAVMWTRPGGLLPLPMPLGDTFTDASGITPDGTSIVGSTGSYAVVPPTSQAVRWNSGGVGTIENLGILPGVSHSAALAVSADGQTIVGYSGNFYDPDGSSTLRAFRWTTSTGIRELHAPSIPSRALAISADGAVVVGTATFRAGPSAFIWTQELGLVNLNQYLPLLGSSTTPSASLNLQSTVGVSADGRSIAGTALRTDTFKSEAWTATLPATLPPCLTLSPVQITPGCPREHATLSINASVTNAAPAPYKYTWQARTAAGEWVDIAGTVAVGCTGGAGGGGGGGAGGTISGPPAPDAASPTLPVFIRPCQGRNTYTVRALVYTDCTSKVSNAATYTLCTADFDCDGTLSVLDIFEYLNAWLRGSDTTDFSNAGPASISNLMAFVSGWFAGC